MSQNKHKIMLLYLNSVILSLYFVGSHCQQKLSIDEINEELCHHEPYYDILFKQNKFIDATRLNEDIKKYGKQISTREELEKLKDYLLTDKLTDGIHDEKPFFEIIQIRNCEIIFTKSSHHWHRIRDLSEWISKTICNNDLSHSKYMTLNKTVYMIMGGGDGDELYKLKNNRYPIFLAEANKSFVENGNMILTPTRPMWHLPLILPLKANNLTKVKSNQPTQSAIIEIAAIVLVSTFIIIGIIGYFFYHRFPRNNYTKNMFIIFFIATFKIIIVMAIYQLSIENITIIYQADESMSYKWEKKVNKVVWRGRLTGEKNYNKEAWNDGMSPNPGIIASRKDIVELSLFSEYNDFYDTKFIWDQWGKPEVPKNYIGDVLNAEQQSGYKYILIPLGNSIADRYPYQLHLKSVIFKEESDYISHVYYSFKPWIHYIPFTNATREITKILLKHQSPKGQSIMKKIAQNGADKVYQVYNENQMICYMINVFQFYASLFD